MNLPSQFRSWVSSHVWLPWATSLLMLLFGAYVTAFARLPEKDRFFDLKLRQQELRCLETGLYPNNNLHAPGVIPVGSHTVYPPTSLVQLWLVSPFASFAANVRLFFVLNIAAFIGVSVYSWRLGLAGGRSGAWFTMSAVWAMSGTLSCVKSGHHGLIINALLILMSGALLKKRPLWAGVAWVGAMVKPHVALTYLSLFIVRRQWLGAAFGLGLMGALGWAVCAFTGHTLLEVIEAGYVKSSLTYASLGDTLVQVLVTQAGLDHRSAVLLSAATAGMILLPFLIRPLADLPILVPLAAAGVAGRIGFYHLHVDDVMLMFLLLGLIENALVRRSAVAWAVTFAVGITVWTPQVLLVEIPWRTLRLAVWPLGLVYLTRAAWQRQRAYAAPAAEELR